MLLVAAGEVSGHVDEREDRNAEGVAGHLTVGNGVKVQAQSGIGGDVPDGQALHGTPAIGYRDYQKAYVEFRRLPETARLVRRLAERAGLVPERRRSDT